MRLKVIFIITLLFFLFACNSNNQKTDKTGIEIEELLTIADENIGNEFTIEGTVSHVCSHSGRRCFLIDETGDFSIRVEASGEISNFSKELMGNTLKVSGILQETRLTAGEIDEWEKEIVSEEASHAESDGEHCSAEMANINRMREWMKEHGRDYYSIYYFEGQSYEVVEQ
jgi:hypothetical protein